MNDKDLIEFCDEWLTCWTGNLPDQLINYYHNDVYYSDPGFPLGIEGKDSLFKYFKKLLNKNPHWVWTRKEIFPVQEGFFLKWKAEIPTSNGPVNCEGLDRVVLKDGKILKNEVYFDTAPLLQK